MMMSRTLVIAEAGVNHNGSVHTALELVDAAADAGADIVKFQTFDAESLATAAAPPAAYQRERAAAASQLEMLRGLQLTRSDHEEIADRCAERGIEFLSTAFDEKSLAWLRDLGISRVKVPSGEIINGPLLLSFARTGLPLLVSTGMASLAEVEMALGVIAFGLQEQEGPPTSSRLKQAYTRSSRNGVLQERVVLLHCTSSYPAEPGDVHLSAMNTLAHAFDVPVGYSDHTLGTAISIAAVARGATVIEKHLTLDCTQPGPDHIASLEPSEFVDLVSAVRAVEQGIGAPIKYPTSSEGDTLVAARKSVVAARSISHGEVFDGSNLDCRRPGTGRSPMDVWGLIGQTASRDYTENELIDAHE